MRHDPVQQDRGTELPAAAKQRGHGFGASASEDDVDQQALVGEVALGPRDREGDEIEAEAALDEGDLGRFGGAGRKRGEQKQGEKEAAHFGVSSCCWVRG